MSFLPQSRLQKRRTGDSLRASLEEMQIPLTEKSSVRFLSICLVYIIDFFFFYKSVLKNVACIPKSAFFFFFNCLQLVKRQPGRLLVVLPSTSQARPGWKG